MFDIKIIGGRIYNGTLSESFVSDIGLKMDKIEEIGDLSSAEAHETVDARGLAVAPGLIDIHSHSDFSVLVNPKAESKVRQGVTTEVIGNCGMSAAPLKGVCKEHVKDVYADYNLSMDWEDFDGYFNNLGKSGLSVNLVPLVGHGNIRASVIGYDNKPAGRKETEAMRETLREAMRQGAFGLSTGLIYPPGIYATTDELVELAKVVDEFQGIYATHMRSEGEGLVEAVKEAILIGEKAGVPVQISHLKTSGQANWHKLPAVFGLIEDAIKRGVDVTADRYPYLASSTDLDTILPRWVYEGGNQKEIERLKDPKMVKKIAKELPKDDDGYWQRIMVSTVSTEGSKSMEGLTIAEIAQMKKEPPWKIVIDLLVSEKLKVGAVFFSMSEENLRLILKKPYTMIGSDSSARAHYGILASGKPHPRSYGTFPNVLGKFVRENVLSMEEAVHKMTQLPARKLRIEKRGVIEQGMFADIVLFDPINIADNATYQNPHKYPTGIKMVIVNGEVVLRDDRHTGATPGRALRKRVS